MSDQPPPTQEPALNAGEKAAKQWMQTRLAHEAVMLADAQAVLKQSRQTVANLPHQLQAGDMSKAGDPQDDGMIHIGDVIQNVTATEKPVAVVPPAVAKGMSTLAKIGMGFAVGGPIGAGIAAVPVIADLLKPATPAVKPAEPKADSPVVNINGKEYQLELGQPE